MSDTLPADVLTHEELDRIAANVAHHAPDEDMPRLIAALREAWSEVEECMTLVNRQGELLTNAVNALRGDPPPLTSWSHHDVAELAADLRARTEKLVRALDELYRPEGVRFWWRTWLDADAEKRDRMERALLIAADGAFA